MAMGNSFRKEAPEEIRCCFENFSVSGKLYINENDKTSKTSEWGGYREIGAINMCVRRYMDRPREPLSDEYIISSNKHFSTSKCVLCNSDTMGYVSGGQRFNPRISVFAGSPYTGTEIVTMIKNNYCIKHIDSYIFEPKIEKKEGGIDLLF